MVFSVILCLVAVLFAAVGRSIYRGNVNLIHDYHQQKVTDPQAYGKAFGKAMLAMAAGMLISGILGYFWPVAGVAVLMVNLLVGIIWLCVVQKKYNQGIF